MIGFTIYALSFLSYSFTFFLNTTHFFGCFFIKNIFYFFYISFYILLKLFEYLDIKIFNINLIRFYIHIFKKIKKKIYLKSFVYHFLFANAYI